MATQNEERLTKIKAAIDALLEGRLASYSIGDKTFTRLDLTELRSLEREYEARVARETRGGIRIRQGVPLP